jgi:hypothetical protein
MSCNASASRHATALTTRLVLKNMLTHFENFNMTKIIASGVEFDA